MNIIDVKPFILLLIFLVAVFLYVLGRRRMRKKNKKKEHRERRGCLGCLGGCVSRILVSTIVSILPMLFLLFGRGFVDRLGLNIDLPTLPIEHLLSRPVDQDGIVLRQELEKVLGTQDIILYPLTAVTGQDIAIAILGTSFRFDHGSYDSILDSLHIKRMAVNGTMVLVLDLRPGGK